MNVVGYAYATEDKKYLSSQLESLGKYGCDRIVLETDLFTGGGHPHKELENSLSEMSSGDQLIVYELVCLGKSIIQLAELVAVLREKNIELVVVNRRPGLEDVDNKTYMAMIEAMSATEKIIIRERTSRGLEQARKNGRVGGRPKISKETVEKIQFLYKNNKHTLREIADECDISLGTAYKYTQAR
ncbi:recombinase family protein [Vagococcus intermedius]|uniref:Recombinase family protein n=1 Tax=Vagococcus intermedius TaxID=2991418 RepID=A0AAF0CTU0_9ENTE|nr:recombinase family protein [Vagococcus intermedius]WEG72879.1 recombinase family protein [Vagococcus intermedius]WEG74966.1 recombinase family protein [Vagococcus intermedius]